MKFKESSKFYQAIMAKKGLGQAAPAPAPEPPPPPPNPPPAPKPLGPPPLMEVGTRQQAASLPAPLPAPSSATSRKPKSPAQQDVPQSKRLVDPFAGRRQGGAGVGVGGGPSDRPVPRFPDGKPSSGQPKNPPSSRPPEVGRQSPPTHSLMPVMDRNDLERRKRGIVGQEIQSSWM